MLLSIKVNKLKMTNQDLHCRNFITKRSEPVFSNDGKLMIDVGDTGLITSDIITHDKLDLITLETTQLSVLSNVVSTRTNTSDTAINTLGISNDTTSINNKITSGDDNTLSDAQQVLLYGRTSGDGGGNNLHSVLVTGSDHLVCDIDNFPNGQETMANSIPVTLASDQSDINTRINTVKNEGTHNNLNNDTTINFGDYSTSNADISNMTNCNVVYSDSSTGSFDSIGVEVSANGGTNWYEIGGIFPSAPIGGALRLGFSSFNVGGFSLMRISNKSTDTNFNNVNASVFGSP